MTDVLANSAISPLYDVLTYYYFSIKKEQVSYKRSKLEAKIHIVLRGLRINIDREVVGMAELVAHSLTEQKIRGLNASTNKYYLKK